MIITVCWWVLFNPKEGLWKLCIQNNQFAGAVVVNILMNDLFNAMKRSSAFDHYIIDKDENYILHKNDEFSFNKYQNIEHIVRSGMMTWYISNQISIENVDDLAESVAR